MKKIVLSLLFFISALSQARDLTISWDRGSDHGPGTTYQIRTSINSGQWVEKNVDGLQTNVNLPLIPGSKLKVEARAIPAPGALCGTDQSPCNPSVWVTFPNVLYGTDIVYPGSTSSVVPTYIGYGNKVVAAYFFRNIGTVSTGSTVGDSNNLFTIKAGKALSTLSSDSYFFVGKSIPAEVMNRKIGARIIKVYGTQVSLKSETGIVIRQDLSPGAPHFSVTVRQDGTIVQKYRSTKDSNSITSNEIKSSGFPVWLKINNTGTSYQAQYSYDGTSFTNVSPSASVQISGIYYVGMISAGDSSLLTGELVTSEVANVEGFW